MCWQDELKQKVKRELDIKQKQQELLQQCEQLVLPFWNQLVLETSKLDPMIRPEIINNNTIYSPNIINAVIYLNTTKMTIERRTNYNKSLWDYRDKGTSGSSLNGTNNISYTIKAIPIVDAPLTLCLTWDIHAHIIQEGDAEIVLRNHLMDYSSFRKLTANVRLDTSTYNWKLEGK